MSSCLQFGFGRSTASSARAALESCSPACCWGRSYIGVQTQQTNPVTSPFLYKSSKDESIIQVSFESQFSTSVPLRSQIRSVSVIQKLIIHRVSSLFSRATADR